MHNAFDRQIHKYKITARHMISEKNKFKLQFFNDYFLLVLMSFDYFLLIFWWRDG